MKPFSLTCSVVVYSLASLPFRLSAADVSKAQNATALNVGSSWVGNAVPGAGDVMLWDSNFTTPTPLASLSQLGGDLSVTGIKVTNVGGTRNQNTNLALVGFQNTSSTNTLTLGAGGIDMSAATQSLYIQSKISVAASQTWNIANANTAASPAAFNNGEDLVVAAAAVGAPINLGGNTVNVTGAGALTISSGYTLSNGTLNVGNAFTVIQSGSSRNTTINSDVILNVASGKILRLQNNSGVGTAGLASAATITVNGGSLEFLTNNAATQFSQTGPVTLNAGSTLNCNFAANVTNAISGAITVPGALSWNITGAGLTSNFNTTSGNLSGAGTITYANNGTGANGFIRLTGDNGGFTGTFLLNGASGNRILRLASTTAGSAAATWNVSALNTLQIDNTTAQLGTIAGLGTIAAVGPATVSLNNGIFPGVLTNGAGTLSVNKVGTGILNLTGANAYTGTTSVDAGTLMTTPSQTGATTVNVATGAAFGVSLSTAATTFSASAVNVAAGGAIVLNTGSLGNPTAPLLNAVDFNPTATTTIRVLGSALVPGTSIPLIKYTNFLGGGFGALGLQLPARTNGTLVDNTGNSSIDLDITSVEQIKWDGTTNGDWDIDPTGTANWRTTVTNASTKYIQAGGVADTVNFDDTATGTTTVKLTTDLSPVGTVVNNSIKDYVFEGSGKLSGSGGLTKTGTKSLTLANTTANDFAGPISVGAGGSLIIGNGTTAGAGVVSSPIANEGTLVLNRPEDHNFTITLTGTGALQKEQANTVTFPAAATLAVPLIHNAGVLKFGLGGTLSGLISGSGQFEFAGGTMLISGTDANTTSGATIVSGGTLQLNKPAFSQALGGNVTLTGGGVLAVLANEQIADTANLNILGNSPDSMLGTTGTETVANVLVNPSVATGQLVMRAGFTVTGTATLQNGVMGVGSGSIATLNAVVMTGGTLRIAGNSAASTMNIGPGGITASGGVIEVKFNTNNQDAVVNLGGDFTVTANLAVNNADYTGANLNVFNLTGTRTFNIADLTTTTFKPDLAGAGSLVKAGLGTLVLTPLCAATYSGDTMLNAGTLEVQGTIDGANTVVSGGVLAGNGSVSASGVVGVDINAGGKVSPGTAAAPVGTLALNAAAAEINVIDAVTPAASGTLVFDLDTTVASDKIAINAGALNIGTGVLGIDDFAFTLKPGFGVGTYPLIQSTTAILGTLATDVTATLGGLKATLVKSADTFSLELVVAPLTTPLQAWRQLYFGSPDNVGDGANDADPDHDGVPNLGEYVFGTLPNDAGSTSGLKNLAAATNLTAEYTRLLASVANVDCIAQYSDNLTTWDSTTATQTVIDTTATTETLRISIPAAVNARFIRLKFVEK